MMLVDKDGERIFCGLEMGLLTKDTVRRLAPEALTMTRDEYVQLAYDTAHTRFNDAGRRWSFLDLIKDFAGKQWDEIQEVYKNAKD